MEFISSNLDVITDGCLTSMAQACRDSSPVEILITQKHSVELLSNSVDVVKHGCLSSVAPSVSYWAALCTITASLAMLGESCLHKEIMFIKLHT